MQVLLLSAQDAMLSRLILRGQGRQGGAPALRQAGIWSTQGCHHSG